jgi:hypothetical protein
MRQDDIEDENVRPELPDPRRHFASDADDFDVEFALQSRFVVLRPAGVVDDEKDSHDK